jgi:hypothetical protein
MMAHDNPVYLADEVDWKLRLGIFRLLGEKYRASWGDQSKFLCGGILNWILLESASNEDGKAFFEVNKNLIEQEAMTLHIDPELDTALSILYTFTLIRLGPNAPERSMSLADRASELNICIRSQEEVCPTSDVMVFLSAIDQYASELLRPAKLMSQD